MMPPRHQPVSRRFGYLQTRRNSNLLGIEAYNPRIQGKNQAINKGKSACSFEIIDCRYRLYFTYNYADKTEGRVHEIKVTH